MDYLIQCLSGCVMDYCTCFNDTASYVVFITHSIRNTHCFYTVITMLAVKFVCYNVTFLINPIMITFFPIELR